MYPVDKGRDPWEGSLWYSKLNGKHDETPNPHSSLTHPFLPNPLVPSPRCKLFDLELFQLEVIGNPTQTGLGERMFTGLCNWRVWNRCGSGHSWFQGSNNVTRVWPLCMSPNGSHSQGLCGGAMANVFLTSHSPGSKSSGRDVSWFNSSGCYQKLGESLLSSKNKKNVPYSFWTASETI